MNELRLKIRKDKLHDHFIDEGGSISESRHAVTKHVLGIMELDNHAASMIDAYSFWSAVSCYYAAGWIDEIMSRNEISEMINKYLEGKLKLE